MTKVHMHDMRSHVGKTQAKKQNTIAPWMHIVCTFNGQKSLLYCVVLTMEIAAFRLL